MVELRKLFVIIMLLRFCNADMSVGLTVIADLALIDATVKSDSISVFSNTFTEAQNYNLQQQKVVGSNNLITTSSGDSSTATQTDGFLNGFYDDEGWWAYVFRKALPYS